MFWIWLVFNDIHEKGNNSHQICTVVANSDSRSKRPSLVHVLPLVSPRLTSESIVLINSIPSILSFQTAQGVLLDLSCWRNLYYLPNKITVQLQGICFHLKRIALKLSNLCILQFYVPVSSSLSICRVKNMLDKW